MRYKKAMAVIMAGLLTVSFAAGGVAADDALVVEDGILPDAADPEFPEVEVEADAEAEAEPEEFAVEEAPEAVESFEEIAEENADDAAVFENPPVAEEEIEIAEEISMEDAVILADPESESVAKIGTVEYETLEEAFAAAKDGDTITLLGDCSGNGIIVPEGKFSNGITVDFGGHTYSIVGPTLAGSTGTKTQAFQLLKGNSVTFKNGAIIGNNADVKMLIQNYSNLTLDGMVLNAELGTNSIGYVLSTNNGSTFIKDTTIISKDGGIAFDVCGGWGHYASNDVTLCGESQIVGNIEVSYYGQAGTIPGTLTIRDDAVVFGSIVSEQGGETVAVRSYNNEVPLYDDAVWVQQQDGTYKAARAYQIYIDESEHGSVGIDGAELIEEGHYKVVPGAKVAVSMSTTEDMYLPVELYYTPEGGEKQDITEAGELTMPSANIHVGVVFAPVVAMVGDGPYTDIKKAVKEAGTGGSVKLTADIALEESLVLDSVSLDLAGHTLTGSASPVLTAKGAVRIENGAVDYSGDAPATAIQVETGALNLDGCKILNPSANTSTAVAAANGAQADIQSGNIYGKLSGPVTVHGGTYFVDPKDFLANDRQAVETVIGDAPAWEVREKAAEEMPEEIGAGDVVEIPTAGSDPAVTVFLGNENDYAELEALNIPENTSLDGVKQAAISGAEDTKPDGATVEKVEVKVLLDVKEPQYGTDDPSVTFEVEPQIRTTVTMGTATGTQKVVTATRPLEDDDLKDMSFRFRLFLAKDKGFASGMRLKVVHHSDTYPDETFYLEVQEDGQARPFVEVELSHFSTLEMEAASFNIVQVDLGENVKSATLSYWEVEDLVTEKDMEIRVPENLFVVVEAAAKEGYRISKIEYKPNGGTAVTLTNSRIKPTGDGVISISAEKYTPEEIGPYTLTISATEGASGDPSSAKSGNTVTVTAPAAKEGYNFLGWYEGNSRLSTNLIYSFVIKKDTVLTAKYEVKADDAAVKAYLDDVAAVKALGKNATDAQVDAAIAKAEADYAKLTAAQKEIASVKTAAAELAKKKSEHEAKKAAEKERKEAEDAAKAVIQASKDPAVSPENAEKLLNALTDKQKSLLSEETKKALQTAEANIHHAVAVDKANAAVRAALNLGDEAGINAAKKALADYDAVSKYMDKTADKDLLATVEKARQAVKDAEDREAAKKAAMAVVFAAGDLSTPAKVQEAVKLRDAVTDAQKKLLDTRTKELFDLASKSIDEAAKSEADKALENAKKAVDAIGKITPDEATKKRLDAAKAAIDDAKKAGVKDLADLQKALDDKTAEYNKAAAQKAAEDAAKAAEDAVKAAEKAKTPSAVKAAEDAIKAAKAVGVKTDALEKRINDVKKTAEEEKKLSDAAKAFRDAAAKIPSPENIREADRAAVTAAEAAYGKLTDAQKKDAGIAGVKAAVDKAKNTLDNPTITFRNQKVLKKLRPNGRSTRRIVIKKGKKLKLRASSSTGAKLNYSVNRKRVASVNANGVIKAKKRGRAKVTVSANNTKVKVLIRVK